MTAPSYCGGTVSVTYTVTDRCYQTTTVTGTFTITAPTAIVLNCGSNVTLPACSTQAQITAAWNAFLTSTTASGGCNGELIRTECPAPPVCGGYADVTWTYTVTSCGEDTNTTTCTRRFTVASTSAIVFNCGSNVTIQGCGSQTAVDSAFNAFLASTTASGGCNGLFSRTAANSPSACGGSVDVTWTYTATACGGETSTQTCTRTFTVTESAAVIINPGTDVTLPACSTQAQLDSAFNAFLASTTATGGCEGALTRTNPNPPSLCGGFVDVTWSYTVAACGQSTCPGSPNTQLVTRRFTVAAAEVSLPVLTCATNITIVGGQAQATVDQAFATWLATATAIGGCNGVVTNNSQGAPSFCGGSATVTFTYATSCDENTTTCQATFTVQECAALEGCTLGYWKNHTNRWCGAYRTCDRFGDVFTSAPAILANLTLLQALNLGGGGIYNLARQGVAALLNACGDDVNYAGYGDDEQAIIAAINQAYATGGTAPGTLGSQLDVFNNTGCPLGGTRATSATNCTKAVPSRKMMSVTVYPNPTNSNFTIDLSTSTINDS